MVLNATFNNISAISWRSILLVEETVGSGKNHLKKYIFRAVLDFNKKNIVRAVLDFYGF
jgi:hypothetical protein